MSAALRNGLLVAAVQVAIVLSLGGKLLYDRATRPRVWVRAVAFDPDLPIRGRYLAERLEMPAEGFIFHGPRTPVPLPPSYYDSGYTQLRAGQLIATKQGSGPVVGFVLQMRGDQLTARMQEPVLIFVPEHANVPRLNPGEETWVEVTVPAKGPPRPIRMGIKKDGVLTPLNLE